MEKKKNTPKLRFPEFTGEWEEKKLGEIAEIITGNTPPTANNEYYNGDCLFVSPYDINGNRFVEQTRTTLTKLGFSKGRKIRAGSSLFVCIGSTIGKVAQNKVECVANQQINSVIPYENYSDDFVYTLLERNSSSIKILAAEQAVPIINKTTFSNYTALVPFLAEQTKIATFLTAVDEKLTQLKKKKTLLEQYKKGVMQKLFSQELRFKDDNNQDFPDWQELPLDKTADIVGGGTPDTSNELLWNGNIQWFTPTELKFKYVKFSNRNITDEGLKQSSAKLLPVGTVLFSSRATIGDASITLKECATNQGFQSFVVGDNLYNEYLYYWIINNKNVFLMKASGSTFLEISKNEVAKINIELPSLPEQQKIANFLSAIDEKISHCGKQIEKMEAWKKGLLQQIFC